jgi:hypothetical protein
MLVSYITNLAIWIGGDVNTLEVSIVFSVALSCVMCSHMLLNVHEQADASRLGADMGVMEGKLGLWGAEYGMSKEEEAGYGIA